nr:hypothetical protein [Tanacetum cinerariifolium]
MSSDNAQSAVTYTSISSNSDGPSWGIPLMNTGIWRWTPTRRLPNKGSPAYDQAQLGRRAAMIHRKDNILEEDMPPQRRFILTGSPPGCDVAESSATAAARAPRSQYDFVDTVEAGQGLIRSPGHDTRTIARAAYLSFEARNRELLARLETLETHMSLME